MTGRAGTDSTIVVTGARGRLGQALMAAGGESMVGWGRPLLDLDHPDSLIALIERDRPSRIIHSAAMTAVDEAATSPDVAMRRNGTATGVLAGACRQRDIELVIISTNEVFDGERSDGSAYVEDDPAAPRNPYGQSKLSGERLALEAFDGAPGLWVVRTAWLYGPPGNDFPDKITAAADKLAPEPLPVVADEFGTPTYTVDLADAILKLTRRSHGGVFHLTNDGAASRYDWAAAILASRRPGRDLRPISGSDFKRASDPPPWGVLDCTRAAEAGVRLRPWRQALAEYLAT